MNAINGEIVIDRPVEVVFDYVADQRNEPTYNPHMLRSEKVTDGPVGVGTQFHATVSQRRRPVDLIIEVTECRRPELLGSRTTRPELLVSRTALPSTTIEGELAFEALDDRRTRLTWSRQVHARGIQRLLDPLRARFGARQEERILTTLKHHLEAGQPWMP